MKHCFEITILLLAALYARSARADGGTVLIAADREDYRITVLASPTPLRAGPIDISVLVQERDTGRVVADATVEVVLRSSDANQRPLQALATSEAATNKLFRAALFNLPRPGRWELSTLVTVDGQRLTVDADVDAAAALPRFSDLWLWTGWPLMAIALFAAHQGLVYRSRRSRG